MPPKPRQRRKQREVSVHMEHSQAESAVTAQGQNPPQPPPSDPNPEVPPTNLLLELIQSLQQKLSNSSEKRMLVQRPFLKMKEETGKNLMKTQDHTKRKPPL